MPAIRYLSPLSWPDHLPVTPRAHQRADSGFSMQMTLTESLNYLEAEIAELNPSMSSLSIDVEQPAVERLRKKVGSRTGVVLQFKYENRNYLMACDRWLLLEHNIYTLHLAFRAWHNIVRWGLSDMVTLLAGFETGRKANDANAPHDGLLPWMLALGLGPTATLEDAVAVYHRRAKLAAHNTEELSQLNILMEDVRHYFAENP